MSQRPDLVASRAQIILRRRRSGLSQPEFRRREGISPGALKNWLDKPDHRVAVERYLQGADGWASTPAPAPAATAQPPRLVPVTLVHADAESERPALEIRLDSGRRIAVAPSFDAG